MPFIRLCTNDPLVSILHEFFGANIVRVPDARIQPLGLISHLGGHTRYRGALAPLLAGDTPLDVPTSCSQVANLVGRRSRHVTLDLGLYILRGFLAGFGLSSNGLAAYLGGATSLAFSLPSVQRTAVDIGQLGRALAQRRVDRDNPASAGYVGAAASELLVIDSVLSSTNIVVSLAARRGERVSLDLPGLERLALGSGIHVAVAQAPQASLTFRHTQELTFAFTCVRLFLDAEGAITALPPDLRMRTLAADPSAAQAPVVFYSPDRVMLTSTPALISWQS